VNRGAQTSAVLWRILLLTLILLLTKPSLGIPADQNILIEHYRKALQVDPENPTLRYYLGVSLLIDGHDREAVDAFTRAYPTLADSIEMNYNFGLAWSRLGDPDSALIYLEQAEQLGADGQQDLYPLGEVYYNIALIYLQNGHPDEALALFNKVLQLNPKLSDVYRVRGDYYARMGDSTRALDDFRRYQAIYPNDPTVQQYVFSLLVNQGLKQIESGMSDAAALSFREAAESLPDNAIPHYYLGYIAYLAGRYDEAVSELNIAVPTATPELQGSIRTILYNCTLALQKNGDNERAWQSIAAIVARSDASVLELNLAGNICLSLKRFASAIELYRRALVLEPTQRSTVNNLMAAENALLDETFSKGQMHFSAGEYAVALPLFDQILKENPAYPLAASYATECRSEMGRQADTRFATATQTLAAGNARLALEQVRSGLALKPADAGGLRLQEQALTSMSRDLDARLLSASALLAGTRLAEAQTAYGAILELDPGNASALRDLAKVKELQIAAAEAELVRAKQAISNGDLLLAQEIYRHLIDINPEDQRFQKGLSEANTISANRAASELRLGRDARAAGRKTESRKHLVSALQFQDNPEIRRELDLLDADIKQQSVALLTTAQEALRKGDLKRTRTLLDKLRDTAPDTPGMGNVERDYQVASTRTINGYLETANTQLAAKDYSQALTGYRRVLDLDPLNPSALKGLEHGKQQLQHELTRLLLFGNALLDRGDLIRAEAVFNEALALDPYLAAAKNSMEQLAQLKQPVGKPGDAERLYLRGIEAYTKGKYEDAVKLWQQVLLINPQHEKARVNIEKARRKIFQIKEYRRG